MKNRGSVTREPKSANLRKNSLFILFLVLSGTAFASVFYFHPASAPWAGKFDYGSVRLAELSIVFGVLMCYFAVRFVLKSRKLDAAVSKLGELAGKQKDSEMRYRGFFETAGDGILILDADTGKIIDANPFLEKLTGYSRDELSGEAFWETGLFKDAVSAGKMIEELKTKAYVRYENFPLRAKNGGRVESELAGSVYRAGSQKIIHFHIRDIAARKETEDGQNKMREILEGQVQKRTEELARVNVALQEEILEHEEAEAFLRRSEEKYRTLIENLTQKVFFKNVNCVYISCNENYARDLKIKSGEIVGKTDFDFFPKILAEKYRRDDKRVMESGKTESIEERYIQDGQERVIHTVKTPVRNNLGNTVGVLGIFWDITAQKKAEVALRESEERYRKIIATMTDYIYTVYLRDGKVIGTVYGQACLPVTGYSPEEFQQNPYLWIEMVSEEDRPKVAEWSSRILANQPVEPIEHRIVRKDGSVRWIQNTPVLLRDVRGNVASYDGVVKDVTGQKLRNRSARGRMP